MTKRPPKLPESPEPSDSPDSPDSFDMLNDQQLGSDNYDPMVVPLDHETVSLPADDQQDIHSNHAMIVLPEGATKADAIYSVSKSIPLNEHKLPTFFYRSDMLPFQLGQLSMEDCDPAVVTLNYEEGYPTFGGGNIFWYQLPHEPFADYLMFQRYLDQAEAVGLRQLQLFAMDEQTSSQRVYSLAKEYYWQERARAYDLFQLAAERKRREIRSRKAEDRHFNQAAGILSALMTKFDNVEEWLKELTAKEAIDAAVTLMKIQRISLGLANNGNQGAKEIDPMSAATGADIMRDITQNTGVANETMGLTDQLTKLMMDPTFALEAQALVIRVRSPEANAVSSMRTIGSHSTVSTHTDPNDVDPAEPSGSGNKQQKQPSAFDGD